MLGIQCFVIFCYLASIHGFNINNSVSDLKLTCSDEGISLKILPEKPLDRPARIYVKGKSSDEKCLKTIAEGQVEFDYTVPIGSCNMDKTGSQRGMVITYRIVFVVSFHSTFLTKVDRAFRLTCTFGDSSSLIVTNFYSVSMIPTAEIPAQSVGTANNKCSYSIHANDTVGPDLRYTRIGEKVVHVWKCANLQSTQYMWVHDCIVSPEYGNGTNIIDGRGCTVDRVVIDQLQYPRMDMVIGHHHAYKFADYPTVLFKCSITVCDTVQKNCPVLHTPPDCTTVPNYGGAPGRKVKRSKELPAIQPITYQVISEPLSVLSLKDEIPPNQSSATKSEDHGPEFCFPQFILLITISVITVMVLFVPCICVYKNRH